MKIKAFLFTCLACIQVLGISQSLINGDFEINTSTDCDYNLDDTLFNSKMANVVAFGGAYLSPYNDGEVDILTHGCYIDPYKGNWCIGIAYDYTNGNDAIAIEIDSHLITGNSYEIELFMFGNIEFHTAFPDIMIGESMSDTVFGELLYTAVPSPNIWKSASFIFTAQQNSNYITVRTSEDGSKGWVQVDNFTINPITKIDSNNVFDLKVYPNPTDSKITIDFGENISFGSVYLMNTTGVQLDKRFFFNNDKVCFDLLGLSPGVYYVKVESNEISKSIKFIKE